MEATGVTLPRDLGDGLVLREGTVADAEKLAEFNADVIRGQDSSEPQRGLGEWTRDLIGGAHPTARASDATIVEDSRSGAIVSSMVLVSHEWSYGGVRIAVGQPELVGTHADYRGRGLVRTQFALMHARGAARGQLMQAITGIPWFYRQFGYELAIARGGGGRFLPGDLDGLPPNDAHRVRPARGDDAAFLATVDAAAAARHAVYVPRDAAQWRYELTGHREGSAQRFVVTVIEDATAAPIGMLAHSTTLWSANTLGIMMLEAAPGVSWRRVAIAALHHLRAQGEAMAAGAGKRFGGVGLWMLRREHPIYDVLRVRYDEADTWYALYTRVPDVAAFLRAVAPALERRVASSPLAGHSAELRLSFYRDGVRLVLDAGRLKTVERWQPSLTVVGMEMGIGSRDPGRAHASFPDLTFLQLLFGLRSIDELGAWYPDCFVRNAETRALLSALFPRQQSFVWPVL